MKNVKFIARALFYISIGIAGMYFLAALISAVGLFLGYGYESFDNNSRFGILNPFGENRMLLGENYWGYKLFSFLLPMVYYGVFFLVLGLVFRHFASTKLFTVQGVKYLTWFYLLNLIVPGLFVLLQSILGRVEEGFDLLAMVQFVLGVFAYFMAAIFQQGVKLQTDQDLII